MHEAYPLNYDFAKSISHFQLDFPLALETDFVRELAFLRELHYELLYCLLALKHLEMLDLLEVLKEEEQEYSLLELNLFQHFLLHLLNLDYYYSHF